MKINRKTWILSTVVCLIPIIVGIILYSRLPAQIPIHWDADGNVNGTAGKFVGVIVLPGILVLVNAAMPFILSMDPRYQNIGEKLKIVLQWLIPLVSVICSGATLTAALGMNLPVQVIAPMFVGLIVLILGNYLPQTQQNYSVGLKFPWTLHSAANWDATHRIAGIIWIICGLLMIATSLIPGLKWIFFLCLIAIIAIPFVYSYVFYRREKA